MLDALRQDVRQAISAGSLTAACFAAATLTESEQAIIAEEQAQMKLLRELLGPFPLDRPRTSSSDLSETARLLARSIYADRAYSRLAILADAVEEGGCRDAELIAHLRGPGPHVRGCWALDLVLDKA